jgi:3-phenylpropionate/trans-cinnamate dioxygenase ferredoxin reductase subunit
MESGVESLGGSTTVEEVRLRDGSVLPAGVVVVGIGVSPRSELGLSAGLDVENGILTNEFLETSVSGIYAAGDVANAFHPTYQRRIRLEHWSSALNQGPAAAKNLLGIPTAYDRVPYFFSDQYEFGMEYRGLATDSDDVVFRGESAEREFIAFWLRDDRIVAAMNANIWDQNEHIEALIASGGTVDRRRLADSSVDLSEVTGRI